MATILVVDDLAANRQFLATLLRSQGHRLLEAADGSEGLAAAQAEHPDLVITDVLMPVMDGYELVRQLRLDPTTRETAVVFHTAHYGAREARALALSSGVSYVLTKPTESEEVLRIVGRVLSGEMETGIRPDPSPPATNFDREHLRLLTDKLSDKAGDLRIANARLRALINIGLELASERDADRLLERVCAAARDLFGATYVTLGILDRTGQTVKRFLTCGADATCEVADASWIGTGDAVPGILGTVVAERRTLRGDNPGGDPARLQLPLPHPEVTAFLAAPIASPAQVYGWICLVGNEGRTFTEDDEHLVLAMAGQVGRIYELEHEIRERKQADLAVQRSSAETERALAAAEVSMHATRGSERLKTAILDVSLDCVVTMSHRGLITEFNAAAERTFGYTRDEAIGTPLADLIIPPAYRDAHRRGLERYLATGDGPVLGKRLELSAVRKDGTEFPIELAIIPLPVSGDPVFTGFIRDITERRRAEEEIRRSAQQTALGAERTRYALEAARVGIWDMDYTTGVLQWSEILESQYGFQPGTFSGTFEAFVDRVHPDDRESLLETVGKAMKAGSDFWTQHRSMWPDGTVRWLSGAGRIQLGEQGEPVRGVGISLDVTERRTLEAQYLQAQKMEAIGRLAGGVAHDFNNLLTGILGYCELLLADLDPDDRHRPDIGEIQKAGLSAARLTRQLLAFSRKEIIKPTLLDVNTVVTDMRSMLGRLIGDDVKIVLDLGPGLARVKADRGQMEQIVMNLAVNARDAMPKGGTLMIVTANVELDEDYAKTHLSVKPGPYVVLTVTDTGTGMTPAVLARLFEPFFTTKDPGKGTGLGLATVHGIVTRSGGSVAVYSEVGRGTSFKVYFPRADAAETVVEAPPPAPRPRRGTHTVLVVEDAEGLRELTRRLLQRQGYTVLVAANAEQAIRLFDRNVIDVLLADVVMPGTSGPELARRLAERRSALKVIYMSGFTEDSVALRAVLEPGITFLPKPFTSDELGAKMREVLDR